MVAEIELCKEYYVWETPSRNFRPACHKGHLASLKCHSCLAHNTCPDYDSLKYPKEELR